MSQHLISSLGLFSSNGYGKGKGGGLTSVYLHPLESGVCRGDCVRVAVPDQGGGAGAGEGHHLQVASQREGDG